MGLADIAAQRAQGVDEPLDAGAPSPASTSSRTCSPNSAVREVEAQGVARGRRQGSPAGAASLRGLRHHDRGRARVGRLRCGAPSRRRTRRVSASSTRAKALVIEAVSAEAVGGAARFSERALLRLRAASARRRPRGRTRFFSKGAWREAERFPARGAADRRARRRARADHRAAPDDRGRGGLAGRDHAEEPCRDDARRSRRRSATRSARRPIR